MNRKAEQGEATRSALVGIGRRLFAKRGYEDTSVESVLEEAGVSRGALYHHFAGKAALFEAVFEDVEGEVSAGIESAAERGESRVDGLRLGSRAWLDATTDPGVRQILLIDAPAVLGWQRWRELDEKFGLGLVKEALREAMDNKEIAEQSIDVLGQLLHASLEELAMIIARAEDPLAARCEANKLFDRFLTSLIAS